MAAPPPARWHDPHQRAMALRAVAAVAMLLGAGWMAANLVAQIEARGIGIGFGFLAAPAEPAVREGLGPLPADASRGRAVLAGLANTVTATLLAAAAALALGTATAALRASRNWLAGGLAAGYCILFGQVPVLLWMVAIAAAFAGLAATGAVVPLLGGLVVAEGTGLHLPWGPSFAGLSSGAGWRAGAAGVALTASLALHGGTRVAETLLSAIRAIPADQRLAALALGLSDATAMRRVVLPQALRLALPDLLRDGGALLRLASIGLVVGYVDITGVLGVTLPTATGRDLESLALLCGLYLAAGWSIERTATRWRRSRRRRP